MILETRNIGNATGMDNRIWTVSEAKARLSEILRLAEEVGPQRIGARRGYMVIAEKEWRTMMQRRPPLGRWLLENMPQGEPLEFPDRREPPEANPFDSGGSA
jgi:hypothetical protein